MDKRKNHKWIRISNVCNNKCLFCLDTDSQDGTFIDEQEIKRQIRTWHERGSFNKITLSGWEASINPRFSEYIAFAKTVWFDKIQTITNWVKFANLDFCRTLIQAWLNEITFSLHGHTSILHDYLTWVPGSFDSAIKWLINIKKHFPETIVNIDIVLNKVNIDFIPDIIKFYNKFGVYEFDLLQIIPFWRAVINESILFYDPSQKQDIFEQIGVLSENPRMRIWTNRLSPEILEWHEHLIQDPDKIKSEILWEGRDQFDDFFKTKTPPDCYKKRCHICFLRDFCENIIHQKESTKSSVKDPFILSGEGGIEDVCQKYWDIKEDFMAFLQGIKKPILNLPKCLGWTGIYETYNDIKKASTIEDYTEKYISDLYRKKSLRCKDCTYNTDCEWIHINFIRSYGFGILQPMK